MGLCVVGERFAADFPSSFQIHKWAMSWGSSSSGSWGKSGWSSQDSSGPTDPNGQHSGSCIAEYDGFGKRGLMSSYYDPKCPGCERDRAARPWGSANSSKGNKLIKGLCLIGGANILRKSIWDWDQTISLVPVYEIKEFTTSILGMVVVQAKILYILASTAAYVPNVC